MSKWKVFVYRTIRVRTDHCWSRMNRYLNHPFDKDALNVRVRFQSKLGCKIKIPIISTESNLDFMNINKRSGQTNGQKNEWPIFLANGHLKFLAIHRNYDSVSGEWPRPFTETRILFWWMASQYKIRISSTLVKLLYLWPQSHG